MAAGRTDTLHVHHQHVMWLAIVRVDVVVLCRVVLFSYSASLGNVPFRLLPEVRYRAFGRHIIVWSWVVWALGYFCCVFSTLMMMSPVHPVFWLCGGCCGGLLCLQRYLYGGFPWIR